MKHINLPDQDPPSHRMFKEVNTPPFSIPNVHLPNVEVYDNLLDEQFHKEVYNYIIDQVWCEAWGAIPFEVQLRRPADWDDSYAHHSYRRRGYMQPRCPLGSDENSIQRDHPIIWKLWQSINSHLDNRYEIAGTPEGMHWDKKCPDTLNPDLKPGWRVYANGQGNDLMASGAAIHRDTPNLADENTVTIIWVATIEWYPSWGQEITFYPEDPTGATGDHQQFFKGERNQNRNFRIGWPDDGKTVCVKPNRLIVYDGRTLHSTATAKNWEITVQNRRIVFRARLKNTVPPT